MHLNAFQGFDMFLEKLTPTSAELLKTSSHRRSIEAELAARFGVRRMFGTGSLRRGTGISGHSDADFFVSLESPKPGRSSAILAAVHEVVQARFPSTPIHVATPAVVLDFGGGAERVEITPAYAVLSVDGTSQYHIPSIDDVWMESSPERYMDYVNECNKTPTAGAAKEMTKLIKAWKYYRNIPVSSLYLEMRAVRYTADQSSISYPVDLYRFLRSLRSLSTINDPTRPTAHIDACSSELERRDALAELDIAIAHAEKAIDAYLRADPDEAFAQWGLLFGYEFGDHRE